MDLSIIIDWTSPFVVLEVPDVPFSIFNANIVDFDQMLPSVVFDQGLHCLSML